MAVDWAMALGVERTFASLNQFRRLRVRYEKLADIHEAFLALASALLLLEPSQGLEKPSHTRYWPLTVVCEMVARFCTRGDKRPNSSARQGF